MWWALCWGVCFLLALATLLVFLLIFAAQVGLANQKEDDLEYQQKRHTDKVRIAEQQTAWTGQPWYKVMQINPLCLKDHILEYEVKRGLRPASSVPSLG